MGAHYVYSQTVLSMAYNDVVDGGDVGSVDIVVTVDVGLLGKEAGVKFQVNKARHSNSLKFSALYFCSFELVLKRVGNNFNRVGTGTKTRPEWWSGRV